MFIIHLVDKQHLAECMVFCEVLGIQVRMWTGLRKLTGAWQEASSGLIFKIIYPSLCTDGVPEVQRGEGTGSGLHSKYFHHRDSEDGQEEREPQVREVLHFPTSLEVT